MITNLSILCIGADSGWKIRLRDMLRETFYKPRLKQVNNIAQCLKELEEDSSYNAIIIRSFGDFTQEESFIEQLSALDIVRNPLLLVSLQGEHQTSSYVGSLYALGYHGILAEPFSSSEVLQMFGLAAERSKSADESKETQVRAASFILKEALLTLDEVAKNLLLSGSGGRALVKLRKSSSTLRRFLSEVDEEIIADLLERRVEKHLEKADFSVHNKQATVIIPKHPGKQLRAIMAERGLELERLATLLKIEPDLLSSILDEEANVDEKLAVALSRVIGQAPEYWLGRKLSS